MHIPMRPYMKPICPFKDMGEADPFSSLTATQKEMENILRELGNWNARSLAFRAQDHLKIIQGPFQHSRNNRVSC